MTAIEKTGEISIAVVRDSIGLVSKVPILLKNSVIKREVFCPSVELMAR